MNNSDLRILLVTQDDPFYLAENINFFINNLPDNAVIVGAIVLEPSPYGKKLSIFKKITEAIQIFGLRFFLHYTVRYSLRKLNKKYNVKQTLINNSIELIELNKSINHKDSILKIRDTNADIIISIAGNQIFKKELLDSPSYGCLNLHTALLPKYRGLMPSFWVLRNNEVETGASVFLMDEGIDSGPIICQKKIKIGNLSQQSLIKLSKKIGMLAIIESIELIKNNQVTYTANLDKDMSYYSFPTSEDVKEFYKIGKKFF